MMFSSIATYFGRSQPDGDGVVISVSDIQHVYGFMKKW